MPLFSRIKGSVLQNTGSTARDHLASERTYLSWMRTGLGFLALGIGVERFNQLDLAGLLPTPKLEGEQLARKSGGRSDELVKILLGSGLGSILYGTTRYFSNMSYLQKGLFKPSYYGAAVLAGGITGIASVAYWRMARDRIENDASKR
ncbi:hypothetical protein D6C85_10324 [Aureobasidium pullulans]|uniref:DUF202 domain-containing protein n=1 Tax=Aureobasidium pullulans TaxID=5580 RepID=A0A4S9VZJ5_AURPU|nr:hypothetical protein D6C85_10324 [Aureobasidium pullulans]TIA62897.1 hypothetical protein D6C76_09900 [Aureobasidium pullulans]